MADSITLSGDQKAFSQDALPALEHVAIIMDGNGRWASRQGLPRTEGHKAGTKAARGIVEAALDLGIRHLTLYTFSKENWKRPETEVAFLFNLLVDFITKELPSLEKRGVQLRILGEMQQLSFTVRKTLEHAMQRTAANSRMVLNLALNYSGRDEIARACKLYMQSGLPAEGVTTEALAGYLYTAGQPDPELIIRTSGECRTSNFLLYQSAYSEYYFTDVLWPDFTPAHLHQAVTEFSLRDRRFGGIIQK